MSLIDGTNSRPQDELFPVVKAMRLPVVISSFQLDAANNEQTNHKEWPAEIVRKWVFLKGRTISSIFIG